MTENYSVQFQLKVALVSSHCLIITMRIKLTVSPIEFCLARWKPPRLLYYNMCSPGVQSLKFRLRTFVGVETAALTFRTKQYSTSYSSQICYGKLFYNDFFLNHYTIALVNNFLKLLKCVVIETVLDLVKKRISYLDSLLSTGKRTILTSSRAVLNAVIAMHVHRQL